MSKPCQKCGASLDDESKFCSNCGAPQAINNVCPQCGATIIENSSFCASCGFNLKQNITATATVNETIDMPVAQSVCEETPDTVIDEVEQPVIEKVPAQAESHEDEVLESAINTLTEETPVEIPVEEHIPVMAQGGQPEQAVTQPAPQPQYTQSAPQAQYAQPQQAPQGFNPPPQMACPPQTPPVVKKKSSPIAVAILLFIILLLVTAGAVEIMYVTGFLNISFG